MAWFESGGQRVYYEDAGAGEAVVVMPGWAGCVTDLDRVRAGLDGYRVVAVDPPGSGRSLPQPRDYSASFYDEDAATVLKLLDALGIEAAHLVGFSDGGEYALVMAATAPNRVRSVVTWGAAGFITSPPERLAALARLVDRPSEEFLPLAAYLVERYGLGNARAMAASWAGALGEIIAAGGDVSRSRAARIACPALLITGTYDPYCGPELVRETAEAIPRGRFAEAEGSGHDVHVSQVGWLVRAVTEWLDGH